MKRSIEIRPLAIVGVFFLAGCSNSDLPPVSTPGTDPGLSDAGVLDASPLPPGPSGTKCYKDDEAGFPKCSWKAVADGETVTVLGVDDKGGTQTFSLRAQFPARFTSLEDCKTHAHGFVLSKAGIDESKQPDEGVYWKLIAPDGTWKATGNGGVFGMVRANNVVPPDAGVDAGSDAGVPRVPTFKLDNHCDGFYGSDAVAIVSLMTVVHAVVLNGVSYELDFAAQHAKDETKPYGYYIAISK